MFFDVSDALRKRCLAVGFLLSMLVDGSSSSHQQQPPAAAPAAAAKIGFLLELEFWWDFRRGVPAPGEPVIAIDFAPFSARN